MRTREPNHPKRNPTEGSGNTAILDLIDERIAKTAVVREDFTELKAIMAGHAAVRAAADARFDAKMDRLAESQAGTDLQLKALRESQSATDARFKEITEARAVADARLAESQAATDARFKEIVEARAAADARFDEKMDRLAESQADTDLQLKTLRESQARTDARMDRLTESQAGTDLRLKALAESQASTDARWEKLDERMDQLTVRLDRLTERVDLLTVNIGHLTDRMDQLTVRVDRLAVLVDQIVVRMDRLVESQEHTEAALCTLSKEHEKTRGQAGGLAITVGYMIENVAYTSLPRLLERDHGIKVLESLHRRYVTDYVGRPMEVNIYGKAVRDGREVLVVGECKSQLSKNRINDFLRRKLDQLPKTDAAVFPVMVTHMIAQPDAEEYARQKGITIYYTYQFPWSIPVN